MTGLMPTLVVMPVILPLVVAALMLLLGEQRRQAQARVGIAATLADPVPQALVLTAIVIGFATTALFLVVLLASRGLTGTDHVDGREEQK